MLSQPPAWLAVVLVGLFALPVSVVVPLVGIKLWEWFVARRMRLE